MSDRDIKIRVVVKDDGSVELQTIGSKGKRAMGDIEKATAETRREVGLLNKNVLDIAAGFGLAQVAMDTARGTLRAVRNEVQFGLGAVEDLNLTVASMSAFMTTFSDKAKEGDIAGAFEDAYGYATKLVPRLEVLDAKTIATGRDLAVITETMMMHGAILDINNKKQEEGFLNIVNALKLVTAGQNQDNQMRQEINSLMEGLIRMTDRLPRLLKQIDPQIVEHIRLWKEEGTLIENVGALLKGFGPATKLIENMWAAVGTTMQTIHTRVLRGAMEPAYKDLLDLAERINRSFMDTEGNLTPLAREFQQVIRETWGDTKDIASFLYDSSREIKDIVDTLNELRLLPGSATEWGIVGYALLRGGAQAGAMALALVKVNEELKRFELNLGSLPGKATGIKENLNNLWDGISGKRDLNTGELIDPLSDASIQELEEQLAIAENMLEHWYRNNDKPGGWLMSLVYGEDPYTHWARKQQELETEIDKRQQAVREKLFVGPGDEGSLSSGNLIPRKEPVAPPVIEASDDYAKFNLSKQAYFDEKEAQELEEYLTAMDSFYALTDEEEEERIDNIWKRRDEEQKYFKELQDGYDRITLEALPEYERAVEQIRRKHAELQSQLLDMRVAGQITSDEYEELSAGLLARMEEDIAGIKDEVKDLSEFQIEAYRSMQQAGSEFFFNIMKGEYDNLLDGFLDMVSRMVSEWMSAQLMMATFGADFGKGGALGGFLGTAVSAVGSFFGAPNIDTPDTGAFISGNLARGGPTRAGSIYEVVETGEPEMLSAGGKYYLLMGDSDGMVAPVAGGGSARGGAGQAKAAPSGNTGENGRGDINVFIDLKALDAKSVNDLLSRNPEAVVGPLIKEIEGGNIALRSTLRGT